MSEFIDREKAIENIKAAYCCGCENYNGVRCRACQIMDAMDVLEDEPAVVPDVQRWRKTSENPPTEKDAAYGKVIAVFMDAKFAQAAPWELAWEDVQFGLEYYKQPLPGGAMFWKRIDQNRQHAGIMNYDDYAIILQDGKFFTCGWIPKISVIAELVRYFVLK